MILCNLRVPGALLFLIIVGQRLAVLAEGTNWGCLKFFSLTYAIYPCHSLGDDSIWTEILSQRFVVVVVLRPW